MGNKATPLGVLAIAVVAFLFAGYLLIPACALAHFGGIWDVGCTTEEELSRDAERLALEEERQNIQRRIDMLEVRIATQRCEGELPEIIVEPERLPTEIDRDRGDLAPLPEIDRDTGPVDLADIDPDSTTEDDSADVPRREDEVIPEEDAGLDEENPDAGRDDDDGFGDDRDPSETDPETDVPRDLADLEGCWNLESDLEFSMRGGAGGTQPFPEWNVCFEEGSDGNGTQVMRSDDGMLCEGQIQGSFDPDGALVLTEEDDLVCNDGTEIFQRTTTCDVDESGVATCESVQPGTGGRGSFVLKRN